MYVRKCKWSYAFPRGFLGYIVKMLVSLPNRAPVPGRIHEVRG